MEGKVKLGTKRKKILETLFMTAAAVFFATIGALLLMSGKALLSGAESFEAFGIIFFSQPPIETIAVIVLATMDFIVGITAVTVAIILLIAIIGLLK